MALYTGNITDMTTKIVYGVLEQDIKIDYILNSLFTKKPQNSVYYLLKIGVYCLLNLENVPEYAIVSECVEVCKKRGKQGASGFVNAVLKKVSRREYNLPSEDEDNYLSITYSKPDWFVKKMILQHGLEKTIEVISQNPTEKEHIRLNKKMTNSDDLEFELEELEIEYTKSIVGGYNLSLSRPIKELFELGHITYQSLSSMLTVNALGAENGSEILDICSAPGGKAIYIAQDCPKSTIVACDIHPHRLVLIQKYKHRMYTPNVKPIKHDATKFNPEFEDRFDYVLVDAPCSCLGTFLKHPDVLISKTQKDIDKLSKIQKSIVKNAVRYLKVGGIMVYSTCTMTKEENNDVTDFILQNENIVLDKMAIDFENDGTLQLMPSAEWDGFYISRFKRV